MNKILPSTFLLSLVVYGLYFFIMPTYGLTYDLDCWARWSAYIFEHGFGKVYSSDTNYLPGQLYEMKLFSIFCKSKQDVIDHVYFLKYFTFIFDVAGALLVSSFAVGKTEQKMLLLVVLLNPAYIHNTVFWGQFDSVFSCVAFASFLAMYHKKFLLSSVLYIVSLNFKFQAIIFLPPLFLLMVYQSDFKINWISFLKGVLIVIFVQTIILLPFIINSTTRRVFDTLKGLSGEYTYISINAANVWHWLANGDLRWTGDWVEFKGITYKKWGLYMFASSLFLVLIPFFKALYFKWQQKPYSVSLPKQLIMFALSALTFFYFNTQMHERYSYPAFLFIASFAFLTGKWWIYGLFSVAYFLNVEKVLQSIKIFSYESYVFDWRTISIFFLLLILTMLVLLYDKEKTATTVSSS